MQNEEKTATFAKELLAALELAQRDGRSRDLAEIPVRFEVLKSEPRPGGRVAWGLVPNTEPRAHDDPTHAWASTPLQTVAGEPGPCSYISRVAGILLEIVIHKLRGGEFTLLCAALRATADEIKGKGAE